jgi:hypothetical protein
MKGPPVLHQQLLAYGSDLPPWREVPPSTAAWLAARERRLGRFGRLLGEFGIDLARDMAAPNPATLTRELDDWCDRNWPALARREWADPSRWQAASWQPAEAAALYTLISDAGLALGERVIRCNTCWAWGIDRYPAHEADGVQSFGRLVVLGPATAIDELRPAVYDALDEAFMRYQAITFGGAAAPRFIDTMRPLLWASHRALFAAALN